MGMNAEQYRKLKKYEHNLYCAMKMGFVRMSIHDSNDAIDIYEEVFGESVNKQKRGCGNCKMKIMRRLAEEYYRYKNSPYGKRIDKESNEDKQGAE